MKEKFLVALVLLSMVVAACTSGTPEVIKEQVIVEKEVPVTVEVEKEVLVEKEVVVTVEVEKEVVQTLEVLATATPVPPLTVGQVTDMGGIDDKSFNATAWKGIEDAMADFGVEGKFLESQQQADYAKNIQQFLSEDLDLIVTVGFLLGVDTAIAAAENPDTNFAIVDYAFPDCWPGAVPGKDCGSDVALDNVLGLTFATDEAAFLAGYLAAGMSKTGKVGTFGGIPIPPVTIFMKGAEAGIAYYNQQHGTSVELLGWDTAAEDGLFTGNFESTDDGRRFAESLMDEGADIILPVAGPVGLGSAAACQERGTMLIGVDTDWYVSAPEFKEVYLTSILKNMDVAVYDAVEAVVDGTFKGGVYVGTLANDGVGISSYHEFDSAVSADLKAEVEAAKRALIAGAITVDGVLAGKAVAEAPDLTGETITLYHFGDLSGPYAAITAPLIHGVEDAVAAINEAGGLYGATLAIKFADTAGSIDEAVAAYDRFTGEGENPLVMVTYGSGEAEALAQRFVEDKITNIAAGLSARAFYVDSGYTFGLGPIYADQIGFVMGFLKDNWDTYKPAGAGDEIKLAHLSWPTAFGQGSLTDESRAYLAELGIEIVAEEVYDLSPAADTTAAILNAQAAGANVIWTNTLAFGTSVILNDLNALGLRDQFVVAADNWAMDLATYAFLAEPAYGVGLIAAFPYLWWTDTDNPGIQYAQQLFEANERTAGEHNVGYLLMIAGVDMAVKAIQNAVDTVGYENLTGEAVHDALVAMSPFEALNGVMRPDYSGGSRSPHVSQIRMIQGGPDAFNVIQDWTETPDLRPTE